MHSNCGIVNHWFYLLSVGGQNANSDRASGTPVVGIGIAKAEHIVFKAFTNLYPLAQFCYAREATIKVAPPEYAANVADAWDEVGVDINWCKGQ